MKKYLLMYNYVFINIKGDTVLLYNAISGKSIVSNNYRLKTILKKTNALEDYIFPLNDEICGDVCLIDIFRKIENDCFGQILDSQKLPVNFTPILDINGYSPNLYKEDYTSLLYDEKKRTIFNEAVGKNIIYNLLEITIHFNRSNENLSFLQKGYKQYPFPLIGKYEEVNIESLKDFFSQEMPSLNRINIIIGEINEDRIVKIRSLLTYFSSKATVFIYSLYDNFERVSYLDINLSNIYLWVLSQNIESISNDKNYNLLGVVTNKEELDNILERRKSLLEYYPFYTGNNKMFCEELMAFEQQDVLSLQLNEKEVFANQNINSNLFGEITILPNGNIHSCVNFPPVGNIGKNSLKNILFDEFSKNKYWFTTRDKVESCKDCIYNFLCPPITNFELSLENTKLCAK